MGNYLSGLLLLDTTEEDTAQRDVQTWDFQTLDVQTGDVVLFHESFPHMAAQGIETLTRSPYGHVGMILRDLDAHHPGLFLLHSDWRGVPDAEDHRLKFGVQISPLGEYLRHEGYFPASDKHHAVVRRLKGVKRDDTFRDKLEKAIHAVRGKPYDLNVVDWVVAEGRQLGIAPPAVRQRTDTFWCSALVGFMLVKLGVMPETTDWTYLAPSDFGGQSADAFLGPPEMLTG